MSKHRIKSMALEDDYEDDYQQDDDEEDQDGDAEQDGLTLEDKEKLQVGTVQVRSALGQGFASITDNEIQDTLWHYYYDISKSVNYLKNKHTPSQSKNEKTKAENIGQQLLIHTTPSSSSISLNTYRLALSTAKNFFQDSPWLNIPPHRRAEILIVPLFPRLGLLGGSPAGEGKMSKIAALAARRRQKENEKQNTMNTDTTDAVEDSASSLSRLRSATAHTSYPLKQRPMTLRPTPESTSTLGQKEEFPSPEYPPPTTQEDKDKNKTIPKMDLSDAIQSIAEVAELQAKPSSFARTLMVSPGNALHLTPEPFNPFPQRAITTFDFLKPSPDDMVLKAQNSKDSKISKPVKQQKSTKVKDSVISSLQALSVTEPERIRSKNLDVLAENRKANRKNAANFVVIGHVDAGKSTLMGRLLFDLKAIDKRTMDKYKKEADKMGKGSFAFAWVLDQGTEERARGVTIDIATNKFETDRTAFTILDAPGHRDFVPNMIAGASQADFAVLVIDASTGEFEAGLKGQTKEHALLVRSMGVSKVVVAVNKMDRTDWSEERFQEIQQQMVAFLTTAGFKKENLSCVPCSGLQGDNILNRSTSSQAAWYSGQTLVEALDTSQPRTHALERPLRMTIGDVFKDSIQNPLAVSGRIEAGCLQVGDQIVVMPGEEKAFIRNIQVDDEPNDWAVAGQNVVLSITEIDEAQIKVGDMLCSPSSPVKNVSSFTARVLAFEHLLPMPLDIHRGRLHVPGRISNLVAVVDKVDGRVIKKKPKVVQPGSIARVVVELESPAPIEGGRIVLRANGETVAAGLLE